MMESLRSIRVRLPLMICGLLIAVLATFTGAAYRYARGSQLAIANSRLTAAATQMGAVLVASAGALRDATGAMARDAAVVSFLRRPTASARRAALARLRPVGPNASPPPGVGLYGPDARRLAETSSQVPALSASEVRELAARLSPAQGSGVGPMAPSAQGLSFAIVARVEDHGRLLGYLIAHRALNISPQTSIQLRALIGLDSRLLLGNDRSEVWAEFSAPHPQPSRDWRAQAGGNAPFRWAGDGENIGAFAPVDGTPWVVGVDIPASATLVESRQLLRQMEIVDILLFLVAALGTSWVTTRITRPLVELAGAVKGVAGGDYGRRVAVRRHDEVGALTGAFNDMAIRLNSTFSELGSTVLALSASNDRYELLFDASPNAKWVYDLETLRFLAVNRAAVDLYGYSREEFLALTIKDVRPEDDVPVLIESVKHLRSNEHVDGQIWRHRRKDGSVIHVEVYSRGLPFDGRPARLVLVNDVSARITMDESLRASEERFRQMAEHIREAFFVIDVATGRPLYISPTWAEIWGRPIEEGHDPAVWFQSIHPDDQAGIAAGQQAVAQGETHDMTFRVIRPDNTVRWVHGRSYPVRDGSGRVYRMVGVSNDVTEMKRAEERLIQSQKMEAVGQLAGGVAHDFNNLLTVILSCSALLLEKTAPDDERHELGSEIQTAGERAAGLTRQLLAFSRRQVLAPRPLELNVLVTGVSKMLGRLIGEDVTLRTVLDPALRKVRADAGQIEQVLVNLAVNARDAMPVGGTLTIETANAGAPSDASVQNGRSPRGPYVTLCVRDTGVGMSPDVRAHVFEPFFTTKGPGNGTGLGLATVHGIVQQSDGYIEVTTEVGHGTTFTIYLPQIDDVAPIHEAQSGPHPSLHGTETVLLVEDEEQLRTLTTRILRSRGYTVLVAENGKRAIELVEAHRGPIHLLLSDVVMPTVGGRELAASLAATRPEMCVLFVSGYTDDTIVRHGVLAEGVAFLQKPFTPGVLLQKVREVLDEG